MRQKLYSTRKNYWLHICMKSYSGGPWCIALFPLVGGRGISQWSAWGGGPGPPGAQMVGRQGVRGVQNPQEACNDPPPGGGGV